MLPMLRAQGPKTACLCVDNFLLNICLTLAWTLNKCKFCEQCAGQIATIPQFSSVNGNVSLQVCMNAKDVVSTLQNMNLVPNNN